MTSRAHAARYQPMIVIAAALGGLAWGATGFVALLDPGPDPGPVGSTPFYLIEGGHALAETGWFIALIGLWRSQRPRIGRVGNVAFVLAAGATLLLAVLTYVVVALTAAGLGPSEVEGEAVPALLVAVASAAFLAGLIGIVGGYIGSGITTIRAGVWPPLVGWLLAAIPVLLFVNLSFYPIGIGIGAAWIALALVARARPPESGT